MSKVCVESRVCDVLSFILVNNAEPDDILELEVDDTESLIDSDDPLAQSPHVWLSNLNVATKAADIQAAVNAELGDEALKGCKVVKSKKSTGSCFAFCTVGSGIEARKLVKLFNRHVLTILSLTIEAKQVESDPTSKRKPETKKNVTQPEEKQLPLTKASTVPKRSSSQNTLKKKVETTPKVVDLTAEDDNDNEDDMERNNNEVEKKIKVKNLN